MSNAQNVSDRELLIRIDERVKHIWSKSKQHEEKIDILEKEKISKGSISYIIALVGGSVGIIAMIVTIIYRLQGM